MVLIERLARLRPFEPAHGIYRVDRPGWHTSRNGNRYFHAMLEDRTGAFPAYGWPHQFFWTGQLEAGDVVACELMVRPRNDGVVADLLALSEEAGQAATPVQLLPYRALPLPGAAARLQGLIEAVPFEALRVFLEELFADDAIALPFMDRPASSAHHHAYPGGLAEHCLEVAERVGRFLGQDTTREARALAIVAGLLHDIGKIRTFGPDFRKTTAGLLVQHDQLTLEVISGPLGRLEARWPDGADGLRYLLTWNESRDRGRTLVPEALAIRHADRFSAARDSQRQAFARARSGQRLARLPGHGPPSVFWLPGPPP